MKLLMLKSECGRTGHEIHRGEVLRVHLGHADLSELQRPGGKPSQTERELHKDAVGGGLDRLDQSARAAREQPGGLREVQRLRPCGDVLAGLSVALAQQDLQPGRNRLSPHRKLTKAAPRTQHQLQLRSRPGPAFSLPDPQKIMGLPQPDLHNRASPIARKPQVTF